MTDKTIGSKLCLLVNYAFYIQLILYSIKFFIIVSKLFLLINYYFTVI